MLGFIKDILGICILTSCPVSLNLGKRKKNITYNYGSGNVDNAYLYSAVYPTLQLVSSISEERSIENYILQTKLLAEFQLRFC